MPPVIRRATVADAPALAELEERIFSGDRLSLRQFRYHARHPRNALVIVDAPGHPIAGYGLLFLPANRASGRIYSLCIHPECRGQGLARLVCAELETLARGQGCTAIRLEVRADNCPAAALYASLGYVTIRQLPGYYEDGGDGQRMEKAL